jgi:hypothetical protein
VVLNAKLSFGVMLGLEVAAAAADPSVAEMPVRAA